MSLLVGLAADLAAAGLGLTWRTDGPYAAGEVGIVLDEVPAAPDEVVALATYEGAISSSLEPHDAARVQVRVRGSADATVSRDRAQAIYDHLHGYGPVVLPNGLEVQLVVCRASGPISLGRDDSGRHEHVVNCDVDWINPNRRGRS